MQAPVEEGAEQEVAECFPGNVSENDPHAGTPTEPPGRSQADTETSINPPTPVNGLDTTALGPARYPARNRKRPDCLYGTLNT